MLKALLSNFRPYFVLLDLYGKSVCLPKYFGTSYASVYATIKSIYESKNLKKPSIDISDYFSKDSCIWSPYNHGRICKDSYRGENGSLECLINGHDVAFISYKTFLDAKSKIKTFF